MTSASPRSRAYILLLLGRVALGTLLLYSAYAKLKYPWITFAATLYGYQLLSDNAVIFVARTLPWFELALGILLIVGIGLRWVAAAATALLAVFFAILVRSFAKGMQIECGCFGPGGDPLSWKTLTRDGLFLAGSLAVTIGAFWLRRGSGGSHAGPQSGTAATQPQG